MAKPRTALFTVASQNYLAFVRTLMASAEHWNPEFDLYLFLVDEPQGTFQEERFNVVISSQLAIPASRHFHFKYNVLELNTAVKPYAMAYLLDQLGFERVLYLDPDICIYSPLTPLLEHLESAAILLTPHLLETLPDDGKLPSEVEILRSGTYNLGFIAVRACENSMRFLQWWQEKLYNSCYVDFSKGLFTDQKWIDLVPGLFDDVHVLREPEYNVAYWNIAQRSLRLNSGVYQVFDQPLRFFHFSGLDPRMPERLSKLQNRFELKDLEHVGPLVRDYAAQVLANGHESFRARPYGFSTFRDGTSLPDIGRRMLREDPQAIPSEVDPFSTEGIKYFVHYWSSPAPMPGPVLLSRIALAIYDDSEKLRRRFPRGRQEQATELADWTIANGARAYSLPCELLDAVSEVLARERSRLARDRRRAQAARSFKEQWEALPTPLAETLLEHVDSLKQIAQQGGSFTDWLSEEADGALPRLASLIFERRKDLQAAFPETETHNPVRYLSWLITHGSIEYQIPGVLKEGLQGRLREEIARSGWKGRALFSKQWARFTASFLADTFKPKQRSESKRHPPQQLDPADVRLDQADARPADYKFGLNIVGYLRSEMGTGEASRCAAAAAQAAGVPVSLINFDAGVLSRREDYRAGPTNAVPTYRVSMFNVNADQTEVARSLLKAEFFENKYNIGYWAWELADFPGSSASAFNAYDEIWVPSRFCQDAISQRSRIPVLRIPHAIEVKEFAPTSREEFGFGIDEVLFLTLFDVLSVVQRKNPLAAVEAFRTALPRMHAKARLVLKINNGSHGIKEVSALRAACADLPITIIDEIHERPRLNSLLRACDALVSLHRSEGFGLSIAEAMFLGKPVIVTAYSGNMDFTSHNNSFLVDYQLTRVGPNAAPYPSEAWWAEPDIAVAANHMVAVANNHELRESVGQKARSFVQTELSPARIGGLIKARLQWIDSCDRGSN